MSVLRGIILVPAALLLATVAVSCGSPKKFAPPGAKYVTVKVGGSQAVPQTNPIEVNARDSGQPGGAGRIVWQADDTSKVLHVEAEDSLDKPPVKCLVAVKCAGPSCAGTANAAYHGENDKADAKCKYRVWIDGMPKPADPDIVIDNCCP